MNSKKSKEISESMKEEVDEKILDEIDINTRPSKLKGISGLAENLFRRFQTFFSIIFISPLAALFAFCLGVALTPGVYIVRYVYTCVDTLPLWQQSFAIGFSLALSMGAFSIVLILVVPLVNVPFLFMVKPYRGPWISLQTLPWYYHNGLLYLVRYTILDLITPSPLNILFFRLMGMKIGKGVAINTSNISDPCLIQLDDYVTIGGSAYIMAHYATKGYLVIDTLHIKRKTTVGLLAKIMGGVVIGESVTVTPNSVVFPKTKIDDHSKHEN